jgi:2-polyprenyl-3-methyl-5-hydroxy-6-metoxy-1,4-benzoquinol methylase
MVCIVCGTQQAPGLTLWHATCPSCAYESGALGGAINRRQEATAINEEEREAGLKALRLQNFAEVVACARRFAPHGGRKLLDVGSAHGWFLEVAREHFEVLGVEPDEVVGARAAARGLPVRQGYFPHALREGERFDVIVFNDVLEHIPQVDAALSACFDRLGPDGLLVLNLPSSRGFFYRLSKIMVRLGWRAPFERLWQKNLPSPHVHYFHPDNLAKLVAAHGFTMIHSGELPALRANGLLERLRCAGGIPLLSLYAQYLAALCAIPVLRVFPSDIIVCVFRKKAAGGEASG